MNAGSYTFPWRLTPRWLRLLGYAKYRRMIWMAGFISYYEYRA